MPFRWIIPILLLAVPTGLATWPHNPPESVHTASQASSARFVLWDYPGDAVNWETGVQVAAYLDGLQAVTDYLDGLEAERIREVEREAARRADRSGTISSSRPSATVGECTGFAVPDYIIQRESGGNPSAYNPSGAYGCAQTLLNHYSSGACRGLDPYTIEGQRQCVWILSDGGTNLQPWSTR